MIARFMILKVEQQILEILKRKQNILIALAEKPSLDSVAASLGLKMTLEKMGKTVKVVASGYEASTSPSFLPKSKEIFSDLTTLRKFIITMDISKAPVEDVAYTISDQHLNIYVTPKTGFYEERDLKTSAGEFSFDLVITLDAPDLQSLGHIYENNAEFFYHTPIINIDHKPENEHFGQINIVHLTATSVSEIVFEIIKEWPDMLDEYIATNLLTGIISKTKSFKSNTVTPRSLTIASHLISSGARREEIVRHLYQSKSIQSLKLWGRVLTKIQSLPEKKIVWSVLNKEDFQDIQKTDQEIQEVIDELIINTPEAEIVFILYPKENFTGCIISTPKYLDNFKLFREFSPSGTSDFTHLVFTTPPENTARTILDRLGA